MVVGNGAYMLSKDGERGAEFILLPILKNKQK